MSHYYDQFEPAWPGHWVGTDRDIGEYWHKLAKNEPNLTAQSVSNLAYLTRDTSVKITDTAIAHAIRESHRN
jgi:hypothetical protein